MESGEWRFSFPVPAGLILAGDEYPTEEALGPATAHELCVVPDELREVAADVARVAGLGLPVEVGGLAGPSTDGVGGLPVPAGATEDVLAVGGGERVHEQAVDPALGAPTPRVLGKLVAPTQWRHPDRKSVV